MLRRVGLVLLALVSVGVLSQEVANSTESLPNAEPQVGLSPVKDEEAATDGPLLETQDDMMSDELGEFLPEPESQVAERRRLETDADDATDSLVDEVVPSEDFTEKFQNNGGQRPRNPSRRRRKRKRIQPRPYDGDVDIDARPEAPRTDDIADSPEDEPSRPYRGQRIPIEDRPLRERQRYDDEDLAPRNRRPYRDEERPPNQRPLRRRRKNRRRPNLEMPADGGDSGAVGEFNPRRERLEAVSRDELDVVDEEKMEKGVDDLEDAIMLRERNRDLGEIPLGSLRGEEPMPRGEPVTGKEDEEKGVPQGITVSFETLEFPGPRARVREDEEASVTTTTPTSTTKKPRRRRLRPRVQQQRVREDGAKETTTLASEEMKDNKDEQEMMMEDEEPIVEVKVGAPVTTTEIPKPPQAITISLSDLLKEKNLSLADILKEAEVQEAPAKPPPRLPITAKNLVRPKLTQLSRVNKLFPKPKNNVEVNSETTTPRIATTTRKVQTTERTKHTTTERAKHTTTERAKHTTRQTSTEGKVSASRMPMLSMQETEEIDPVKMTDKQGPRNVNNSKAAEFLKSRVRLPPTGVYFPSVKLAKGLRGNSPSAPDQEVGQSRETNFIRRPHDSSKNKAEVKVTTTEAYKDVVKVTAKQEEAPKLPVYVLNPKFYKPSLPSDNLPPTETNIIPAPELVAPVPRKETKKISPTIKSEAEEITEPIRLNIPLRTEPEMTSAEVKKSEAKSAEDEIVELLTAENGSGRLSRILASRNMTLSELIEHRERGASQQRISDIFLSHLDAEAKIMANKSENDAPVDVKNVPKLEDLFKENKGGKIELEEEGNNEEENFKRVPRVFEGLQPFKPVVTLPPTTAPGTGSYTDDSVEGSIVEQKYDTDSKESYPDVEDEDNYRVTYGVTNIENVGKVREIGNKVSIDHDFIGLPSGMKSILLASSAVLGLTIFVFLAIFITCKVRKQRSIKKRYARRASMLHHDMEKSRSMSPVLMSSGYKDMTVERRYYLWNTIRKTLRYK